ncbi:Retrovirus-related Pol polyprotein from transposon RE1 [Vitis vinifera]|uniref:Retrovirus-related Pol polyprotein from transposon RE1 n=1 Tax=Vitis vinifera TaxID=29760 RepID=A0A438IK05_VITVI|nr:Retrovirus-related Pol polyprotein from transposon RE1 [Vitis vinifera]
MATKNPIFTSVISGSPTITSEKLIGSENYLSWSASVELWFMGQGYEDHLVTPEDAIPEVDKVQWKKIDAQLCSVLWQSVDPKILHHLCAYKTCFKFWTQAKGLYTNDIQRFYKVVSDIVHVRQQDMDLSTYIGRIASLKEEFLTLMPFTNGAKTQQIQTGKFFMVLTLIGLRPDLESVRDQIVVHQYHHWMMCSLVSYASPLLKPFRLMLHGRPPHTVHIAQSSDPLLSRPDSAASSTSQSITLTGSDYDAYLRYQAATSASVASVSQTGNVFICFTQSPSLGPWILNSGASDHISGNKHLFSSITTTSALLTVTLANGSQTMAKGIGLAHPLPSLPLHSDRSTGKTIGIGRESQGLYHLTSPSSPTACISTDAPLLIHSRLGHPSLSKFQKMVPRFSTLSSLACELCQLRKHTRVSFPKRLNNRAKSPFELVHIDVWGLCRTASTLGFQYFVTFIDDYSRCTWLFLMKNRAELFSIFQKFYTEIQTQFNVSIRVLRSDNAREYFSTTFTSFMSQHGILHQSSRAHTPQQNRVAERKNRHLVEIVRTLILHSHVPFCFSSVVQEFGMLRSEADHLVFYHHNSLSQCIYLIVYVDDTVITGNDQEGIQRLKQHLFNHFQTKDLGKLKYFLGLEIAQSSSGVVMSQRKYALDILEETSMLECKPVDTPMDPNVKLVPGQGEPLRDPGRYRQLVGKPNYLTITRSNISFPVSVVSQFLQSPCDNHWDAMIHILRYIKGTPGQGMLYEDRGHTQIVGYTDADWAGSPLDRRSTSGYCVFIGGNLISWKSKKQNIVVRSSAEVEYRAMALATCELIWLRQLLQELRFGKDEQIKLVCDNQAALHIASNPVFHERTKHIEVDCHFIREKIASGCVATSFVNSNDQLANIFTKSLKGPRIKYICNKLGAHDIYAPA